MDCRGLEGEGPCLGSLEGLPPACQEPGTCELHCDCHVGQRQAVHGLVRAAGPRLRFKRVGAALLLGCPSVVARADDPGFRPLDTLRGRLPALGFRIKCLLSFEFTFPTGRAVVVVSNRESRVADIDEDVRRAFSSGRLSRHAAQTLRGRITFARAQLFGRRSARTVLRAGSAEMVHG